MSTSQKAKSFTTICVERVKLYESEGVTENRKDPGDKCIERPFSAGGKRKRAPRRRSRFENNGFIMSVRSGKFRGWVRLLCFARMGLVVCAVSSRLVPVETMSQHLCFIAYILPFSFPRFKQKS